MTTLCGLLRDKGLTHMYINFYISNYICKTKAYVETQSHIHQDILKPNPY